MIPGPTEIAEGGAILTSSLASYPLLAVVLAFVVVIGFGVTFVVMIRRAIPKGGR